MIKTFLISALLFVSAMPAFAKETDETAFERIMRTGTIRCGYYVFPPITYRDPNTKALSGISVDIMNYIAAKTSLKIEWTEEVTFANWVPALQSKKADVMCTPMWPELSMARAVDFSDPMFFAGMYPVVRADDKRFDKVTSLDRFNKPDVTAISQDGNATFYIAHAIFPDAKHYVLGPEADTTMFGVSLQTKKADVMLADFNYVGEWNKSNKSKLKLVTTVSPVKYQQFPFSVEKGEVNLLNFLNLAVHEMTYNGEMDRILRKWEASPGKTYMRVMPPVHAE